MKTTLGVTGRSLVRQLARKSESSRATSRFLQFDLQRDIFSGSSDGLPFFHLAVLSAASV